MSKLAAHCRGESRENKINVREENLGSDLIIGVPSEG
jgi:hypothetical protein